MSDHPALAEREILSEALQVPLAQVSLISREPLGKGSVTGCEVRAESVMTYYVDSSRIPVATPEEEENGTPEVRIWMHPADPHLPALAPVAFEHAAETLLARLGLRAQHAPVIRAYRAGRRAVLSVVTDQGEAWVKVVRPSRLPSLIDAHNSLAAAGVPVPPILGWSPEGLIVMQEAQGKPLLSHLGDSRTILREVEALRSTLADADWTAPVRSVSSRIDWYASREVESLNRILTDAERLWRENDGSERVQVVVHGDLHFGQLFVDDAGRVTGVIDVDTLGVGHPAEDESAFLSHAIASALLTDASVRAPVWDLADSAAANWGSDPTTRAFTAVHLSGHALAAYDRGDAAMQHALIAAARIVLDGDIPSRADT